VETFSGIGTFLTILTISSVETSARIEGTSKGEQRDFSGINAKVHPILSADDDLSR